MKRCPQCGRDYDDSMAFCLDDGSALLFGPAGSQEFDEPQTAILPGASPPNNASPSPKADKAERTPVLPADGTRMARKGIGRRLTTAAVAATVIIIIIAIGVLASYRYFKGPVKQIESIAVMPFVNDSGNADVEYLSDGMTETLINSLSQIPNLSVKARSSVFRYKGKELDPKKVAAELNVQAILTGRVLQRGEQMTLNLELIDAQTENTIWGNRYERRASELVALQSEIARDVSLKIKSRLSTTDDQKV